MSRLALHRAVMPNIFLYFFYSFFSSVCIRRLSTLLPPMCVILVVYCTSCVCYLATSCVPSLTPSLCTVAALSNDFTDEVILSECVYRKVCSRSAISLKECHVPIVRMPGILACMAFRQSSRGLILIMLLMMISLYRYGFPAI